jgi:hypothetical protein
MKALLSLLLVTSFYASADTGVLLSDSKPASSVTRVYFGRIDRVHEPVQTEVNASSRAKAEELSGVLREEALAQMNKMDFQFARAGQPNIFVNVLGHESAVIPSFRNVVETPRLGWSVVDRFAARTSFVVATSRPTTQAKSELMMIILKVISGRGELLFEENYNLGLFHLSNNGHKLKIQASDYASATVAAFIGDADRKKLKSEITFVGKDGESAEMNLTEAETAELLNLPPRRPSLTSRFKSACSRLVLGKS